MSYRDTIIEFINMDIQHHEASNPDFAQYTEKENQIYKEAFIKGMNQSKMHVEQVWQNDIDNAAEAIEDMICCLEEYLDERDIDHLQNVMNGEV